MRFLLLVFVFSMLSTSVSAVEPVRAEVKPHNATPALVINGKPVYPMGFLAGVTADDKVYKEVSDAGIHIYMDYVSIGNEIEGKSNFASADTYFSKMLALDPQAYFLPRVGVTAPGWWQVKYPDECCKFASGLKGPQSLASDLWKQHVKEDLAEFIKHICNSQYGDRVLGFLLCTGYSAEWQSWGLWDRQMGDYSEPSVKAFRKWLLEKYKTDEAIQTAWKDVKVSITTAEIPKPTERLASSMFHFRDPEKDGTRVTDFYQYYSDTAADAIIYFACAVKEASEGNMLAGAFYGYMNQHGPFQQESGHNSLGRVLDCKDIDFLASPSCYSARGPGGTSNFMTATDSVALHGKLFFNESDIRTFLSPEKDPFGRCGTPEETLGVIKREMGHVLSRGSGIWWFDMTGGWFSDKRILDIFSQFKKTADSSITKTKKTNAQVAVFYDDRSFAVCRPGTLASHLTVESVAEWPRAGMPQDFYLLSDISHPGLPEYKLYVFINVFMVSDEQIKAIHDKLAKDSATALWLYAPGYVDADKLSTERMKELTGINLACLPKELSTMIKIDPSHPLAAKEKWTGPVGTSHPHGPVFYADDPDAQVIGTLETNGKPGFVAKKMDGWTSVFYASPYLPPQVLRAAAEYAGAHIYCRSNDCFYANRGVIALHASGGGEKEIMLPEKANSFDLFTGSEIAHDTDTIKVKVNAKDTLLLRLE